MSQAIFVDRNGERIDITGLERTIETRCDGCGEFVATDETTTANLTIHRYAEQPVQAFAEGHQEHVNQAIYDALVAFAAAHRQP